MSFIPASGYPVGRILRHSTSPQRQQKNAAAFYSLMVLVYDYFLSYRQYGNLSTNTRKVSFAFLGRVSN